MVFGGVSLSYTRTMLVFCNLANWSQYFLSKSDSSCTWAKWFANRTKNFDPQPGTGQCLHFSFFILTVRKQTLNWTNLFATRNLSFIFEGTTGTKGIKDRNLVGFFFLRNTREGRVGKFCVGTHSRLKSENDKKRVFYKLFYLWITHATIFDTNFFFLNTPINLQHNFIYLEA